MSIKEYLHERMLMHAGLLRESDDPFEDLMGEYSDAYKAAFVGRPSTEHLDKISMLPDDEINKRINSLYQYAESVAAAEMEAEERDAEKRAYEAEITALMPSTEEERQERVPVGLVPFWKNEGKMRVTRHQLQKIIKEEVSRVLKEMEIINFDTGELLTVDQLPPKYTGRLTKDENGHAALYDQDFEALRRDIELDPAEALGMLEDYAAEEMGGRRRELGTAIDIAMGFKMSYPKEWQTALRAPLIKDIVRATLDDDEAYAEAELFLDAQHGRGFRFEDYALARFLAERMG